MRFAVFFAVGLLLASPASPNFVGLTVSIGSTVTLPCDGAPGREVQWYFKQPDHDRMLVAELHTRPFSPGSGFQGRVKSFHRTEPGNYSLLLSPVVYSDHGIYECCYKNETNTALKDVNLKTSVPSLVSVEMGMPATLPCFGNIDKRADAGDLDILWTRGRQKVYHLHKNTISYGLGFENRVSLSPEQALLGNLSLTIKQTQSSDEGDYQCTYSNETEKVEPDSATLTFAASTGFSAAKVAWIVVGVIVLVLILVGSAFAIWKCLNNRKRAEAAVCYQAASAEDQNDSNSRAACLLIPDGPEPSLSVSETQPALPEPHLPVSEKDPSFLELHLPEPETEQIEVQEKMPKSVELL
ncbi:uncharacterized protein LOC118216702 [Anguilla anguilla]|uniref:uncharacterized protein LOC118216702 n=1 Tax=Anguilla anguilla TaxID=7936 RepID=UPI0015A768CB|nr:uncharacterized protein LOC118216702 [Anguilla anguilla]